MPDRSATAVVTLVILVAVAIGIALYSLREEPEPDEQEAPTAECDPVGEQAANEAQLVFEQLYLPRSGRRTWYNGVGATTAESARATVQQVRATGGTASTVPDGNGWVLLVTHDRPRLPPDVQPCLDDTPVVYVGSGPVTGD